jgi:hypothetical protein
MKNEYDEERHPYSRAQTYRMVLPLQFWLLCRLLKAPPREVIYQFMTNVGRDFEATNGELKNKAMEYFLESGYGQDQYTTQDICQMFLELDAIAGLWPVMGSIQVINKHAALRDSYLAMWEEKWHDKLRWKK